MTFQLGVWIYTPPRLEDEGQRTSSQSRSSKISHESKVQWSLPANIESPDLDPIPNLSQKPTISLFVFLPKGTCGDRTCWGWKITRVPFTIGIWCGRPSKLGGLVRSGLRMGMREYGGDGGETQSAWFNPPEGKAGGTHHEGGMTRSVVLPSFQRDNAF